MKTSELVATAASQVACRLRRLVLLRAAACTNIIIIFFIALNANAMPLNGYIASLSRIETLIASDQIEPARADAKALIGQQIESLNGPFHADDALLGDIANAKRVDVRIVPRLAATIAALRRINGMTASATDDKLLTKLEEEQRVAKPKAGGNMPVDDLTGDRVMMLTKAIGEAWSWLGDKIARFFEWLDGFWPQSQNKEAKPSNIRGIVVGVVILIAIVVAILAWMAIRRSRAAAPQLVESSAPIASSRDEDPLSRATNEWERYAAQLAAAGRNREAIRAWYHAVLVALYGAAILHFRKGRTNWEYVATLSPSLLWRGSFIELTRRFENEWYGASESSAEALDDCSRRARTILSAMARVSRGAA